MILCFFFYFCAFLCVCRYKCVVPANETMAGCLLHQTVHQQQRIGIVKPSERRHSVSGPLKKPREYNITGKIIQEKDAECTIISTLFFFFFFLVFNEVKGIYFRGMFFVIRLWSGKSTSIRVY